jgi:hypothetical protein
MDLPAGASSEEAQKFSQEMMDTIYKVLDWDNLKKDYVKIYADTFTEDELQGIINFYKSPAGKKFVEKTPELMQKAMEISQRQMGELMPKIQTMVQEKVAEYEKEESAPVLPQTDQKM